ncbi:hypothetical protein LJC33_00055 [Eubacteriales bacterium OttesenSCG-928-N13]|nr:hypothetical protein [Eubacteriales bacterium OttesenSCG-928-N13]
MGTITEANEKFIGKLPENLFIAGESVLRIRHSWSGSFTTMPTATVTITDAAGNVLYQASKKTTKSGALLAAFLDLDVVCPETDAASLNVSATTPKGIVNQLNASIDVCPYSDPRIGRFEVIRANAEGAPDEAGTSAAFSLTAEVAALGGANSADWSLRYRARGASDWIEVALPSGLTQQIDRQMLNGLFALAESYEFELRISDRITSAQVARTLSTAKALIHLKSDGTGLAIGKYSDTADLFDVALPTRFEGAVTMQSPLPKSSGGLGADVQDQAALLGALRIAAGVEEISMGGNKVTICDVIFPAGRFTSPPSVTVTPNWPMTYASSVSVIITTNAVTTDGCEIRVMRVGGARTIELHWQAIQYT